MGFLSSRTPRIATFTPRYDADFESPPSLATLAGTYAGNAVVDAGTEGTTVTVSSTGTVSGEGESGCQFSGTAIPRTDGNVYDLAVTFGSAPCYYAGQTLRGVADFDVAEKRLSAAVINGARTAAALFIGTRP